MARCIVSGFPFLNRKIQEAGRDAGRLVGGDGFPFLNRKIQESPAPTRASAPRTFPFLNRKIQEAERRSRGGAARGEGFHSSIGRFKSQM